VLKVIQAIRGRASCSHARVRPRVGEVVAGRRDERISAPFYYGALQPDAVRSSISSARNSSMSLTPPGWMPKWLPVRKELATGFDDPVDVAPDEIKEFPSHYGDLRLVYAVRTIYGTPPALSALVEVIEPLLKDVHGESRAPASLPKRFPDSVK